MSIQTTNYLYPSTDSQYSCVKRRIKPNPESTPFKLQNTNIVTTRFLLLLFF